MRNGVRRHCVKRMPFGYLVGMGCPFRFLRSSPRRRGPRLDSRFRGNERWLDRSRVACPARRTKSLSRCVFASELCQPRRVRKRRVARIERSEIRERGVKIPGFALLNPGYEYLPPLKGGGAPIGAPAMSAQLFCCAAAARSRAARLSALRCGTRQGERIRRWLSSSSRVS
jgi:hypothetical protein